MLNQALAWSIATLLSTAGFTFAHDGPDPLGHWYLQSEYVDGNLLKARLGPDGELQTPPRFIGDATGESLMFEGRKACCMLAANYKTVEETLPRKAITVSAWVSIDTPRTWGGIIGVLQDNGGDEKGWTLGYDESKFYFAIATTSSEGM